MSRKTDNKLIMLFITMIWDMMNFNIFYFYITSYLSRYMLYLYNFPLKISTKNKLLR